MPLQALQEVECHPLAAEQQQRRPADRPKQASPGHPVAFSNEGSRSKAVRQNPEGLRHHRPPRQHQIGLGPEISTRLQRGVHGEPAGDVTGSTVLRQCLRDYGCQLPGIQFQHGKNIFETKEKKSYPRRHTKNDEGPRTSVVSFPYDPLCPGGGAELV